AATQTALSSTPTTAPTGTQVTVFAAITTNSFGNPPTGTVTFFGGGKPLGPPVAVFGHFDSTSGLAIAEANIVTTSLAVGTDVVTAVYSGDGNYDGSAAPGINVIITAQ